MTFSVSADGRRLSSVSGFYARSPRVTVDWWNLANSQRELHADLPVVPGLDGMVGMSADGTRVMRRDRERQGLWLYDTVSRRPLVEGRLIECAGGRRFSPDGSLFASSGEYGTVEVVDGRTLAPVALLKGHGNMVHGLAFSADNRLLGTASTDGTARIWNLAASPVTSVVLRHPAGPRNICFSPDSSTVATIASDRAIRVWDTASGELRATYATDQLIQWPLMMMPDGRTVAGREEDGTVRFWDVTAESTIALRGHVAMLYAAKLAPHAGLIVSGGWDGWRNQPGAVRVWDADTGEPIGRIGEPGDIAWSISISPDNRLAAIFTSGPRAHAGDPVNAVPYRIELLDLRTGRVTRLAATEPGRAAFSPAGDTVALVGQTTVRIIDIATGKDIAARALDKSLAGACVAWSRDGRTIAAGMGDNLDNPSPSGCTLLLDARTLQTQHTLASGNALSVAFSPDGARLAAGGRDGRVHVFDRATGEQLASMSGHGQVIMSVAFSPDGSRIASGGLDSKIRLWDTATYDQVAAIGAHTSYVSDLDWDPAGERLISASGDHTVRIWEPAPIRNRLAARDARSAILPRAESLVTTLFNELSDPAAVADRLDADPSLDALTRKTALQLVLKRGLSQTAASQPQTASHP